ncbi:MAG: DNA repair protein RecO [Gammaproteobacteria bacterium]|nr:DNA repair protein RecO [Gammaproteobacteria bacterium]
MSGIERSGLQPGYVLHSRMYRDTSLLLEVFTAQQGRVSLVARGARRRSRKGSRAALLQPFIPLLLSYSGRAELKTLTAVESAGAALVLPGQRAYSGLYVNELLTRLMHRYDPYPTLFAGYASTLAAIASPAPVDGVLRRFELLLLDELGYTLNLRTTGDTGESIVPSGRYRYEMQCGLRAVADPTSAAPDSAQAQYEGAHLLAIAAGDFNDAVLPVAKHLLRAALAEHLGDEPLRSRELFQLATRTRHELAARREDT